MKALAVIPGRADSLHLADLPRPTLAEIPGGRGVLVKVLRVGVDGTDKEINAAEYGAAPPGSDVLVIGHECLGRVVEVGPNVTEFVPGELVVPTVRRPGRSLYDRIGQYDLTTDDVYFERGINLRHGFLTEFFVEDPEYLVRVPERLGPVGVLLEPTSVIEKGIVQAFEIQRRLKVWHPRRAAVLGTGTIGLLASMALRVRGLEVTALGRRTGPYRNADLLRELGARYVSSTETPFPQVAREHGPFDLIFEATGSAAIVFEAMENLGKNGVLVLSSVTGGGRSVEVPADRINLGFVLGNKVMVGTVNANRDYFEAGVQDFSRAELQWPEWLGKLLTHPVDGLEKYREMMRLLTEEKSAIKVFVNVASEGSPAASRR
ncbi:MAG TPA: glucose 1-dehydrogenase [Planctomycetota bacterium]|nr:glucose 1-dehydrogenase [Planctomycetota bacterium]